MSQPSDDIQDKIARMGKVKKKIEEIKQNRSTLHGEFNSHKERKLQIESECMSRFGVDVQQLPSESEKLEKEAESAISKAEGILGVDGDG